MLEPRIYRAAFLPLLPVLLIAMFAIQGRPEPVVTKLAPDAFSSGRAAAAAKAVMTLSPNREPGSAGNRDAAAFVAERFASVGAGRVSVQRFNAPYQGRTVAMQNVVLVLPGLSDRRLVVMASRDSASRPGANSSAAGTGSLVELAADLAAASHRRTLVLASVDGRVAGAAGARRFASHFPGRSKTEAAIVLEQPALAEGEPPYVSPWSIGSGSTAVQLVQSAKTAIREEVGRDPGVQGFGGSFLRLATRVSLQQQGPLIQEGIAAVSLSSDGELPPTELEDEPDALSPTKLGQFGRATLSLLLALDADRGGLDHGPSAYVTIGDNVIPGWSLALLGLALLVPALLAAVDGFARARRRRAPVGRWLRRTLAAAVPFVAAVLAAYLLELAKLIPDTGFPYDPARYPVDGPALAALALLALAFAAGWRAVGPLRGLPSGTGIADLGRPAAIGLVLCASVLAVWLLNPYAGLLFVPAAHLGMLATLPETGSPRSRRLLLLAVGLVPPLLAVLYVASLLGSGPGMLWQGALLVTSGQLSFPMAVAGCLLGASLLSALAAILGPRGEPSGESESESAIPPPVSKESPDRIEPPGASPARIGQLRASIAAGTYSIDPLEVAESILRRLGSPPNFSATEGDRTRRSSEPFP